MTRMVGTIAAVGLVSLGLVSCSLVGPQRSVGAYCETLERESDRLTAKYDEQVSDAEEADPLAGLVAAFAMTAEALGDLAVLSEKLAELAPEEVRIEHETVAESMRGQADRLEDAAGDPLGALVGGVVSAVVDSGSFRVVDEFSLENCGLQLFGSAS